MAQQIDRSTILRLPTPANDNWPLVLTRPEVAEMCRISVATFDAWVRKNTVVVVERRNRCLPLPQLAGDWNFVSHIGQSSSRQDK
jgi:hypothetical protein